MHCGGSWKTQPCDGCAGIAEPIKGGVEVGLRLGLGKAEEERQYTAAENVVRKRLEVEIQADEDAARTQRREVGMATHVLHSL